MRRIRSGVRDHIYSWKIWQLFLIFLIWMIDPYKESIIKRQTKNNGRISFYAKKNTKQFLPAKFEPVYKDFRGHTEDRPVFMVSNKIQRYGAGVICYEDFLGDISRKYNKSLYLLPTSIHEMLLLFDDGEDQEEDLLHILEKSDQQLSKEEFLSDNIYYYDKYMGELISLF